MNETIKHVLVTIAAIVVWVIFVAAVVLTFTIDCKKETTNKPVHCVKQKGDYVLNK
jgi:hypothetical protein